MRQKRIGIDLTPLVDVVFLLLIFFMVASNLNQLEKVEIDIPVATHSRVPDDLSNRRTITVKENGDIYLGNVPSDMEDIGPRVKKEREKVPGLKIYLRAAEKTPHKFVRDVMKECAAHGAAEILFATYEKE